MKMIENMRITIGLLFIEGYVTQERIWKVLELPENDSVDAMLVAEGEIDFSVAYLVTFIESKEATRRELKIGSDDAVKVWLNGEVVHTAAVNRPLTPDQDKVAVDLKEGMNCLMVKAADSTLDWKLTIRFLNESGLQFFDTPNRQILSLGRRLIHLSNPQFETPEHGGKGIEGLWKTYRYIDGLAGNRVTAFMQDKEGAIWFATDGGANRFDGVSWKTYTQKDGLASNSINAIMQDREGIIWFATAGSGVSQFDGKSWKTYTQKDELANDDVSDIMQDKEGVIWIGTYSGGVSRFDGKCFQTIDSRDGLVNDSVSSIYMDRSEQIWFGTQDGAVQFTPNKVPPLLYITQVLADEKTYLRPSESLNLQSGIRRVVFSFRAISFKTRPGGIKYFYQLVGKDSDWQGPTNNETVEYFDLKSGQYTFKVQAVDRDLNYSKIASVTFKIRPPFYMTTAFIVPTVSLSTILLVAFMYLSITFFKHRKQILAYQKFAVQELQDARQMQMSLIPENAPPLEGFEIAGKCISANTVSGDFFDYLPSKNKNEVGIVIGDVTGKGLKGAMNAVMTDGILHSIAKGKERLSPASLLMEINDILKDRMERDMNVTMVIGLIDAESQTLTLANAGHHIYPILLRNGEIRFLKAKGLPVGVKAGIKYGEEQFPLGSGDVVIFMTDGIIEARDREDKLYLESGRLEKTISQFSGNISAEAMVDAIIADAIDFGGSKDSRDDDMTVVVVKVL